MEPLEQSFHRVQCEHDHSGLFREPAKEAPGSPEVTAPLSMLPTWWLSLQEGSEYASCHRLDSKAKVEKHRCKGGC